MRFTRSSWVRAATLSAAVALGLPLSAAGVLTGCHTAPDLPTYGVVQDFSLRDETGSPFTRETMMGRTWIAAFVFTRCPSACPRVTRAMRDLQVKAAQRNAKIHLVSFSVDPEFDTPVVLQSYAKEYGADLVNWSFVTGNAATIQRTAEQGLKIAAQGKADPTKADFGITHGTQLVLLDARGTIRGYYASNDDAALARLLDDATRLAS